MTYEGYKNYGNVIVTGLVQSKTFAGQDGANITLNGGYAQKSAAATQAVPSARPSPAPSCRYHRRGCLCLVCRRGW
jgi:hypothetical protein